MTKFLFASFPVSGHVNPGLPIAAELVRRGHDVRWYSTQRFRKAIEAIGARFVPYKHALKIDEARVDDLFPNRPASGIRQLQFDLTNVFIDPVRDQFRDIEEELKREAADVIVGDNASVVTGFIHEKFGIPWAVYGVSILALSSRDTPPFGLGLMPEPSIFGRLRDKLLYWVNDNVLFREARQHDRANRRLIGLAPYEGGVFDFAARADLYLQSSVPSFEYARTDMPETIRWIGAPIPAPPVDWTPPSWWSDLDRGKRVVLVTQGTINNEFDQLIRPAIRGLAREDVIVVVTTGSKRPEDVGIDPLPANVRVERFIPYAHLMPKVDLLVTNGGYGSIQIALAHGVPVVAIGKTEEKPEIANRVTYSRVGIGLKVLVPEPAQVRDAVARVFEDPSYRLRAEVLKAEMAGLDAASRGADLLEELAGEEKLRRTA